MSDVFDVTGPHALTGLADVLMCFQWNSKRVISLCTVSYTNDMKVEYKV
jgi:hypothetical protein